jgi:hypothetical protein
MKRPFVRGSKLLLAALVALPLLLAARTSLAFTYQINGSDCRAMESGTEGLVSVPTGTTTLVASGAVEVVCPMVKHTSVPNGFNDYISDVTAAVVAGAGGVSCHLNFYSVQVHQGDDSLQQENADVTSIGPNTHSQVLDLAGSSIQPYFDEGIASPYDYWYSSEVFCTMQAGTTLTTFHVTENGSSPANYRMYSAGNCKPTSPGTSSYQYFEGEFGGGAGFWEAKQAKGFTFNCPVPSDAGRGVQLAVGPSISGDGTDQLQCTGDAGSHWTTIPQNPSAAEWPTRTVSFAFKSGVQNIQCRMITNGDNDGDGKVAGYRSFPLDPIPHTGWTATASIGANTASAFDGNLSTRWTTTNQTQRTNPAQWFLLDMHATQTFIEVVLDSTGDANDFPHGYTIEASMTGAAGSWTTIASGAGASAVVTVPVPMTTARYLRINQTGTDSHWWSIHELNVYSATPHNPYLH